jgi:hypothetical protein
MEATQSKIDKISTKMTKMYYKKQLQDKDKSDTQQDKGRLKITPTRKGNKTKRGCIGDPRKTS